MVVPDLIIESVDTVDRGTLVITAEKEKVLRILDLRKGKEKSGAMGCKMVCISIALMMWGHMYSCMYHTLCRPLSLSRTLYASSKQMVSSDCLPRST